MFSKKFKKPNMSLLRGKTSNPAPSDTASKGGRMNALKLRLKDHS